MNIIYNEDCIETMNKMQSNIIDCVLTSPPYNILRTNDDLVFYDLYKDNKTNDEYIDWTIKIFNLYNKVLKNNGIVIYNINYGSENTTLMNLVIADILKNTPFTLADIIIWKKNNSIPNNVSPNKLTRIVEFIYIFCRKEEFYTFNCNKQQVSNNKKGQKIYENILNFITAKNNDESNDLNKATFSTELVRKLLQLYTKKGDLIYDSFMGTGTTANACLIEDRLFVGSEISKDQCEYANKRIKLQMQPKLF